MRPKVTAHTQGPSGWFGEFLSLSRASHIKGVGFYPSFSDVTVIGRPYVEQTLVDAQVRRGSTGADVMFDMVQEEVKANPQVDIWETPANESSIWDQTVAAGFVDFTQRMIYRFHSIGKKIIVGSINTGWPRLPSEDSGAMMASIAMAATAADGLSFHEYDPVALWASPGYNCLRYRKFHEFCLSKSYSHPPIYITECGIDRVDPPGPDFGHAGWIEVLQGESQSKEDQFVSQLIWYEGELQKDDYVECATIFTAVPSGWGSFDLYQQVAMKLAQQLHYLQPTELEYPPIKDMAKGFFASEFQGNLDFDAIRDAGYTYVHIRASCGLYNDPTFERNWHKAGQVGLLRSIWHFVEQEPNGQAAYFKSVVDDRMPELGIFADFENVKDMPPLTREKAERFLEATDRNFGTVCNIYSSPGWLNSHGGFGEWEAQGRELWLGHWTENDLPLLPDEATYWTFWQWKCTDAFGPFPERVCLDRFAGTREALFGEYGVEEPTPPLPPNQGESKMWFRDSEGDITEAEFRWKQNDEGKLDGYRYGYEVVPAIGVRVWEVDGMVDDAAGPVTQWVRVKKVHSTTQPPDLMWGFPDPDSPDEVNLVEFKDKGDYWEAEYMSDNCYYPDRPMSDPTHQGPYFFYIANRTASDMVRGAGFVAGTNYKEAIVYYKPAGAVGPGPEGDVALFDAAGKRISEAVFQSQMGEAFIMTPELSAGEEYLKIVELWIREVPKPRFARILVSHLELDGIMSPVPGVPFKFFGGQGAEGAVFHEGVTNAAGAGEMELGAAQAYAVPGAGPLNLRIKKEYPLQAEQFRDYGMVRITGEDNRHCDVIYVEAVWGEVPDPDPEPDLPEDILTALLNLELDHDVAYQEHIAINSRLDIFAAGVAELSGMLTERLVEIERLLKEIANNG